MELQQKTAAVGIWLAVGEPRKLGGLLHFELFGASKPSQLGIKFGF